MKSVSFFGSCCDFQGFSLDCVVGTRNESGEAVQAFSIRVSTFLFGGLQLASLFSSTNDRETVASYLDVTIRFGNFCYPYIPRSRCI